MDTAVVADCGLAPADIFSPWKRIAYIDQGLPPGWDTAVRLMAQGVDGLRVPSVRAGGVNFVLWRWNQSPSTRLVMIDPFGNLLGNR